MVVSLGDGLIIEDIEKFVNDKRKIEWMQVFRKRSAEFIFIPFYRTEDVEDLGFVAIEASKYDQFLSLCHEVQGVEGGWGNADAIKYEFTVTKQFKYGQGFDNLFRFLVFQDPSYDPFQHKYDAAANSAEAGATLRKFIEAHSHSSDKYSLGVEFEVLCRAIVYVNLHSF